MPFPYLKIGQQKIAPFKNTKIDPYGAFANTTKPGHKPIKQTLMVDGEERTFLWPSSEHAFHAQKILHLKNKLNDPHHPAQAVLTDMLDEIENTNEEYDPRGHYDTLVTNYIDRLNNAGLRQENNGQLLNHKHQFDALCDADYHVKYNPNGKTKGIDFMRTVVKLKLEQHDDLRKTAMACAEEGIFPVEISHKDDNWASGKDGAGLNMLGIIILEEANELLRSQGKKPAIDDPWKAYSDLKRTVDLSHDKIAPKLQPGAGWVIPNATTHNRSAASEPPRPNLIDKGVNQRNKDHYYLDSNTGVTMVVRPDGRYHFSQNRQTVTVSSDYERAMKGEYDTKFKGGSPSSHRTFARPDMHPNGSNGKDHYYLDRNTGITLVVRPDGYHFSKNKQTVTVSPDYERAMKGEYDGRFNRVNGSSHQTFTRPDIQANGSNGKDHYYLDRNTGITLVVRPDGYHFSKNKQTVTVPPDYERAMKSEYDAKFNRVNGSSHHAASTLKINYKGTNGRDHYFLDEGKGVTLVQRPDGFHFSQNRQPVIVDSGYQSEMIKKVTELKSELKNIYKHSTLNGNGRSHADPASLDALEVKGDFEKIQELKQKYKGIVGDALKTSILLDFKTQLEKCDNRLDLENKIEEIEKSPAYRLLEKGQGKMTQLFGLKTSSIDALEKLIRARRDELPDTGKGYSPS